MNEIRVELQGACFSYGDKPILRRIDLTLAAGEILSLLGPNGCGKTTLLRCASGLLPLDRGQVRMNGRALASLDERERALLVGFVFQEHQILFPYTVHQVVQMGRAPHLGLFSAPGRRDRQIADQALERVGIRELAGERISEISGGERQLALIARALAQEPAVLMLDEPTSHLDFGNQARVLETVRHLVDDAGLAVLMTTHYPDHALSIADRAALMREGRLLACGTPDETVTQETLKTLYHIDVQLLTATGSDGRPVRTAVPLLDFGPGRLS